MCAEPKGIVEQETAYVTALESATAYQIGGDRLRMTNVQGVGSLARIRCQFLVVRRCTDAGYRRMGSITPSRASRNSLTCSPAE